MPDNSQNTKVDKLHRWSATIFSPLLRGGLAIVAIVVIGVLSYPGGAVSAEDQGDTRSDKGTHSIQLYKYSIPFPEEAVLIYEMRQSVEPINKPKDNSFFSSKSSKKRYGYEPILNIIIHHWKTKKTDLLFETRMRVQEYFTWKEEGFFRIIATVYEPLKEDKKKEIQKKLLVYDIRNDIRKYVNLESYKLLNVYMLDPCDDKSDQCTSPIPETLVVSVGVDRNGDGKFEQKTETIIPMKVDIETMKLVPLLDPAALVKAQDILDGKTLVDSGVDSKPQAE